MNGNMAQASFFSHSPLHRTKSPDILVTSHDEDEETSTTRKEKEVSSLAPPLKGHGSLSDGDKSDRYYTASSGEDYDDDDDDEDGICIRLDSDDDAQSLSGLHINLKTLQAVSSMLAHYSPIIQSDSHGNPTFIAPPPPPEDEYFEDLSLQDGASTHNLRNSSTMRDSTSEQVVGDDDFHCALQELEDALIGQDQTLLTDAMSELTDVMEKMTYYEADQVDDVI